MSPASHRIDSALGPPPASPEGPARAHRLLPLLVVLFIGSGCSALIYEIVWFQLLQFVIGSSAVSLGVLLGTFMGGMCLGSLALPRLVSARRHPLRVYAALELGIGLCAIAVLFGMPQVGELYVRHVGHGFAGILMRGVVGAVCLLLPTMLMGATLPAIARWVEATPRGVSWLGFFYGGNIAGAVFGCLLAGFYLLRVHDMRTATFVAAALNAAVATAGFALAAWAPHRAEEVGSGELGLGSGADRRRAISTSHSPLPPPPSGAAAVYVAIALSGLTALGAEVVWTRLLSLMIGGTVYTFSIILAVFLIGLGIGSGIGSFLARDVARPRAALGCCQLLLAAAVAWGAYMICHSLPYWPINPGLSASPWFNFQLDLMRCLWALLPATCLWGASFPLALAAVASRGRDPGRVVGGVYAANTVGAIVGSLLFGMVVIPWRGVDGHGTQFAQQIIIGLSVLSALLVFIPQILGAVRRTGQSGAGEPVSGAEYAAPTRHMGLAVAGALVLLAAIGGAVWLALNVSPVPGVLVAFGRNVATNGNSRSIVYVGEGMNASVAVTKSGDTRYFHVSGKVEASSEPTDMRLQRMLGHVPALFHPRPKSVLIVGCGAGVTAGSFLVHPDVERVVICEIEPLIPRVVAQYFGAENYHVVDGVEQQNPRTVNGKQVEVVYDDARHFVLTTPEKFDIITSDPIHPWVKGAASLYTREYFEVCKRHLNPGGMVTQWVPLYESDAKVVKSELATFFDAFPNGTIWGNESEGGGYDTVVLGQDGPGTIDVTALAERLNRPEYAAVAQSLDDVGLHSWPNLLATYAGRGRDIAPWLAKDPPAQINRDGNLRLQYLAGMELNNYSEGVIYSTMLDYRKFPEDLFVATDTQMQMLRRTVAAPREPQEKSSQD